MLTTHIDTLREWWERGEGGTPNPGDLLIIKCDDESFLVEPASDGWREGEQYDDTRILARAPIPKPAWHDAVAVLASTSDFGLRRVFVKDVDGIWNDALSGRGSLEGNLLDVTPLIEAKVTDEMIDRILNVIAARFDNYPAGIGEELAVAALGLETA